MILKAKGGGGGGVDKVRTSESKHTRRYSIMSVYTVKFQHDVY